MKKAFPVAFYLGGCFPPHLQFTGLSADSQEITVQKNEQARYILCKIGSGQHCRFNKYYAR